MGAGQAPPTFSRETEFRELAVKRAFFVTFNDGARTFWHTRNGAQTQVVTEGKGWFQYWDKPKFELSVGAGIEVQEGVKHCHEAPRGRSMTHLAKLDGATHWLEEVEDAA